MLSEPPDSEMIFRTLPGVWPCELAKFGDSECIFGIDEAGRGPVLGPMVYGACYTAISNEAELSKLGFADSKTLTDEKREYLFAKIKESTTIGWMVHILSAGELSGAMLQANKYNLNAISHDTATSMIQRALEAGVNVTKVFVDTVGDPERYEDKLSKLFPSIQFTVRKKADSLFPIVSAASICAKVTRDHCVRDFVFMEPGFLRWSTKKSSKCGKRKWDEEEDYTVQDDKNNAKQTTGYGSGYPGDAVTKQWLAVNGDTVFGFPNLVRFSWSTTALLLQHNAHPFAWAADEEEDAGQSKLSFGPAGSAAAGNGKKVSKATFLVQRGLEPAANLGCSC